MCFDLSSCSTPDISSPSFSPLFIGACVSTGPCCCCTNHCTSFSPLFIGACVSTRMVMPLLLGPLGFQSPLHRGMCFDQTKEELLAVPKVRFSPLFIGACVSTSHFR